MNYATVNDLCARYTRTRLDILTRPKTADGQPDDAVAEQALADASAFIDGYLAARFVLPLTVVPSLLKRQCCVVAWFYLNESQPTEQITAAYRDTVRWLEQVRDGKTDPGVESRTAASPMVKTLCRCSLTRRSSHENRRGLSDAGRNRSRTAGARS
ncbi:DUF1320 domain-containing protein [Escherichia coli]|uniref:DUF1320 domain-containing protein n=8 Tax=Gammaproteobacteria TaxID=1236 RepID=UPI002020A75E|nr:DUF1320 domain-containing protein [Escherichia coli]MCL7471051.1 DUF1320 domain-containing protein [Escherichia coli]